ncbi:MAG: hypothetical protein II190_01255 [Ruminococcus sp.]|nr:hypothetical protein [Ruminococcus sp.]
MEIIDYLVDKENDETLQRAYKASYAALQNITFDDFKRKVYQRMGRIPKAVGKQPTVEETLKEVENIIDNYEWTEV